MRSHKHKRRSASQTQAQERLVAQKPNYAYIDAQNLHMAVHDLGWKIDYMRLRKYLREHYQVEKAYLFMGYKESELQMYTFLESAGFTMVFKPLTELKDGTVKGNCDAELVMQAMIDRDAYHQAVVISGDGDFYSLIKYLQEQGKLRAVLAPSWRNCSSLISDMLKGQMDWVSNLRRQIQYLRRTPRSRKQLVVA